MRDLEPSSRQAGSNASRCLACHKAWQFHRVCGSIPKVSHLISPRISRGRRQRGGRRMPNIRCNGRRDPCGWGQENRIPAIVHVLFIPDATPETGPVVQSFSGSNIRTCRAVARNHGQYRCRGLLPSQTPTLGCFPDDAAQTREEGRRIAAAIPGGDCRAGGAITFFLKGDPAGGVSR